MEATKYSRSCNTVKFVNDFNRLTSRGYDYRCKQCSIEHVSEWTANNRAGANERERNRYVNNSQYRISRIMHTKINGILRHGKYSERLEQVIGLTPVQFLDWISFNFKDNMCWYNYSTLWQFDLVIPASSFDLTVEAQLQCCFN